MGIESERPALSIESIPKSIVGVPMEQQAEVGSNESKESPERHSQLRLNEKNGNLDIQFRATTMCHKHD